MCNGKQQNKKENNVKLIYVRHVLFLSFSSPCGRGSSVLAFSFGSSKKIYIKIQSESFLWLLS